MLCINLSRVLLEVNIQNYMDIFNWRKMQEKSEDPKYPRILTWCQVLFGTPEHLLPNSVISNSRTRVCRNNTWMTDECVPTPSTPPRGGVDPLSVFDEQHTRDFTEKNKNLVLCVQFRIDPTATEAVLSKGTFAKKKKQSRPHIFRHLFR